MPRLNPVSYTHLVLEYEYNIGKQGAYNRLTLIPVDWDEEKKLHHFLLAFETIRKTSEGQTGAKEQLQLYYEQLKQSSSTSKISTE